ncbi:MAG: hypothetical protein OEW77_11490, partial [Gemmatimonadota bacterium]|nr:hypothetical protein [Gemmatimonadota bacterium]
MTRAFVIAGCAALVLVLGAPLAEAQPHRMPPPGWVGSPKEYDALLVERDLMMPTRDGKRMAT